MGATLVPAATAWNFDACGYYIDVSKVTVTVLIIVIVVAVVLPSIAIVYS